MKKSRKAVVWVVVAVLVVAALAVGGWLAYSHYRAAHALSAHQREQVVAAATAYVEKHGTYGPDYSDTSTAALRKMLNAHVNSASSGDGVSVKDIQVGVPDFLDPAGPFKVEAKFTSTVHGWDNPNGAAFQLFALKAATVQERVTLTVRAGQDNYSVVKAAQPSDRWVFDQKASVPDDQWKRIMIVNATPEYPADSAEMKAFDFLTSLPYHTSTFSVSRNDFGNSDLGYSLTVTRFIPCGDNTDAKQAATEKRGQTDFTAWLKKKNLSSYLVLSPSYVDKFLPCPAS